MSNLNIGPIARAIKWRKRYVAVWFGLLIISELAAISLTELSYFRIAYASLMLIGTPLVALYEHPAYLITIPVLFLLFRMVMRFKITALMIAALFHFALLIWPLFYPFFDHSGTDPDIDDYVLSTVFALPGLIASLVALWNEMRYRAAAKSLLSANDLSRIQTFERTKRPKVDLPPESRKSSAYESLRIVTIAVGIFICMVLLSIRGFDSGVSSLMTFFVLIASWLYYLAQKHNVRTADEVAKFDSRPPVLILRSFKSDRELSQTEGHPYTSLIDRFVKLLRSVGHPIALPDPKIPLPFPGVAVVPVPITEVPAEVADWQKEFNRRVQESGLIIIFVSDSSGLLWEIQELLTRPEALQRTALIFTSGIKAQESANFIRFLLLRDNLPVAEKLYNSIRTLPRISTRKQRYFSLEPCRLDKWLPRRYVSDGPLLIRFSKCGDPVVITGPLVWEGYEVALKRYILTDR